MDEAKALTVLVRALGEQRGNRFWEIGQLVSEVYRAKWYYDLVRCLASGDFVLLKKHLIYKYKMVDIETFINDAYYLDKKAMIWPKVMEELKKINSGNYVEAVLTGGIGSAKTTVALYTTAYQLYQLSCLVSPHEQFQMDPSSEIIFVFQSIRAQLAKDVEFSRFKSMVEDSPYFSNVFPFNRDLVSKLVFPNLIEVLPVSGLETAAIGQNVIGGVIDELNYMAVVESSQTAVDKESYDQAVALYNSISRRRKSRFMIMGHLPGILCLVSSKRYPGQFTDRKIEEAKKDPTIYVYDKRTWEVKPKGTYTGAWFYVFIGDESRRPRILMDGEKVRDVDRELVMRIPVEHRLEFETDIINALREVGGVSTLARHPFIVNTESVTKAMVKHK